jgi:hypothetical protein
MKQYFYMTIHPMEALIASQLEPTAFATYMAVGARKGAAEALIFIQVNEETAQAAPFNWDKARSSCVAHSDGTQKRSFYLSIYRVLENLPAECFEALSLVTRDGRCLELPRTEWENEREQVLQDWQGAGLYKELCPVLPLVISRLKPGEFGNFMTSDETRIKLPALVFADLRMKTNLPGNDLDTHYKNVYDQHPAHLQSCLDEIKQRPDKVAKIVDRTYLKNFSYSLIKNGVFYSKGRKTIFWPMPTLQELKENNYDWGKSANIF